MDRGNALLHSAGRKSRKQTLNALLGTEFIKMGNSLLYRRRIGDTSEKQKEETEGVEEDEEGEDNGSVDFPKPTSGQVLKTLVLREARIGAVAYAFAGAILWAAWAGCVLLNVNIPCGYTQMRLPGSPGPWNCARYWPNYTWGLLYAMWFNFWPPIFLVAATVLPRSRTALVFHWWVNLLVTVLNVVAFFSLLGIQWGWCNTAYSFGNPCMNFPLNCCVNGASSEGAAWCPTNVCSPQVSFSQLGPWDPFWLTFLWSVFFFLWDFFGFAIHTIIR